MQYFHTRIWLFLQIDASRSEGRVFRVVGGAVQYFHIRFSVFVEIDAYRSGESCFSECIAVM